MPIIVNNPSGTLPLSVVVVGAVEPVVVDDDVVGVDDILCPCL